jgi:ubiquinone/menaquinone biosynthesis C-methylase UbiE
VGSTPPTDNTEQRDYWNGAGGERWVTHQQALDRMVRPFGAAALERLACRAGEHVLDIGCGCGDTLIALTEAVGPSGSVTGIDLSLPMLERARARLPAATLIAGDASAHRFERAFDAVYSRFGVMFFADPPAAFARLRAALVPGGRIAFVCWRAPAENSWASVPFAAIRAVLPDAPPGVQDRPGSPGPFAFAERDTVESVLRTAGFSAIQIEPFDAEVELTSTGLADAVHFAVTAGPAARLLAQASAQDKERATKAVRAALAPHLRGDRIALHGATWIARARAS